MLDSILYYPKHFLKFQTLSEYLKQEVVNYRETFLLKLRKNTV